MKLLTQPTYVFLMFKCTEIMPFAICQYIGISIKGCLHLLTMCLCNNYTNTKAVDQFQLRHMSSDARSEGSTAVLKKIPSLTGC